MIAPSELEEDEIIAIDDINPDDLDAKKFTEFYPDGETLKFEVPLKDGLKNGTYREYYEDGSLKVKGKFKSDKKDGLWKTYNEKDKTIQKTRYRNGKKIN